MSLYNINNKEEKTLIAYKGVINEKIIIKKGEEVRDMFKNDIHLSRKIFSVYMELIQNIFYYSCEIEQVNGSKYGVGNIEIVKRDNKYVVKSRNLAETKFVENINKKFPIINQLSKEQLRKLKISTRREPQEPLSKGAGIGLIQLAIVSGNPLKIFFEKKDLKHAFYNIHVSISAPV